MCPSLVAQLVKNLLATQETWVRSLVWEDPREEGMATTPVFLPGESPWTEKPGGLHSMGSQRVRQDWVTKPTAQHVILGIGRLILVFISPECSWEPAFRWWVFWGLESPGFTWVTWPSLSGPDSWLELPLHDLLFLLLASHPPVSGGKTLPRRWKFYWKIFKIFIIFLL